MARKYGSRKRRQVPWAGWAKIAPQGHARTVMKRNCGRKCFLGPDKSFPVCAKGTCKVNSKGAWAAYIRAREWGKKKSSYKGEARPRHRRSVYTRVARKAKRILERDGFRVGEGDARRSKSRRYGSRRSRSYGRRTRRGGMRKCPKGSRHRLVGQVRRGNKIVKHGHFSKKCTKKRGRK